MSGRSGRGEGSQRCIVSYITFDVIKTLKGKPSEPYVLRMLGGIVGDKALEVDGAPKFAVGDENLLFVEHNGTQFVPLVGIMHGYFRISTDPKTAQEIVLKYDGTPLRTTAEMDREHGLAVAPGGTQAASAMIVTAPMSRSDFEDAIQKKAGANP